jgi:hypothetical protein
MGNYVCIYPSEGSNSYDYYFINVKPVNVAVYEFLYSDKYGFLNDLKPEVVSEVAKRLNFKHVLSKKTHEEKKSSPSLINQLTRSSTPNLADYLSNFVGHQNWVKKLLNEINFKSLSKTELVEKLTEKLEKIIFDIFQLSELKNSCPENGFCNKFEFLKNLIKKVKKAINSFNLPEILNSSISDTKSEEFSRVEKYITSVFNKEIMKLSIPETDSEVLSKL